MDLWTLSDLSTPWCIHVVATLRIARHVDGGITEIGQLAAAAGADPDALHRVLSHLVSRGVFEEPTPGRFALNDLARQFLDSPTLLSLDLDSFGGRMAYAWSTLLSAVRTGKPAYHEVFGRPYWENLDAHPNLAAAFDELMGPAGHGVPDPQILPDPADWPSIHTVVDVGGGTGTLLAEILRAQPHVRGTLVDLPRTVARSAPIFQKAGVSDRATVIGQSFFDPLPAGCDLYVLKNVLGDWPDTECTAILKRCAGGARPHGRVITFASSRPDPELLMLILVGGKARTPDDFRPIAESAGLRIHATAPHSSGRLLIEFRPL